MEGLLYLFHERANDITDIQEEYVSRIQGTEGQKIEGYLSKIVELNEAIKNSNILGSPALELNDQRNQLIDELATYLPIDVTYEDQNVGGNITVDTLNITFTDSKGVTHTLLDDDQRGKAWDSMGPTSTRSSMNLRRL